MKIGKFTFDFKNQLLTSEEHSFKLAKKEAEIIKMLSDNLGKNTDRKDILNEIWKDDNYFNARSLDVYITKLRRYFYNDDSVVIITVHGIGFKLIVV